MNCEFPDPLQLDKCYICDKALLNSEVETHFTTFHESDPIKEEIKDKGIDKMKSRCPSCFSLECNLDY